MAHPPLVREDGSRFICSSIWTASRDGQVIDCELLVPGDGQPILRCGFGPQSIIRSQFLPSADAASAVAETWKAALLAHGFRVVSGPSA